MFCDVFPWCFKSVTMVHGDLVGVQSAFPVDLLRLVLLGETVFCMMIRFSLLCEPSWRRSWVFYGGVQSVIRWSFDWLLEKSK